MTACLTPGSRAWWAALAEFAATRAQTYHVAAGLVRVQPGELVVLLAATARNRRAAHYAVEARRWQGVACAATAQLCPKLAVEWVGQPIDNVLVS